MGLETLLSTRLSAGRVDRIAGVALAESEPGKLFPKYRRALRNAVKAAPPPFATAQYARVFREAAKSGYWLATSLIVNSQREGDGATRLWSMAACAPNEREKQLLKRHAVDESGHSLAYLRLVDLAFPGTVSPAFRKDLDQLSPHYHMKREPVPVEGSPYARVPTIDEYVQMNIAEIRTTIHHAMQRRAIANHCPKDARSRIVRMLDYLMGDELRHVAYTAVLIEEKCDEEGPDHLAQLFTRRLNDFNELTRAELAKRVFD